MQSIKELYTYSTWSACLDPIISSVLSIVSNNVYRIAISIFITIIITNIAIIVVIIFVVIIFVVIIIATVYL